MNVSTDDFTRHGTTRRAPRYPITAPVQFRADAGDWIEGTTVNICASGLLIRTRFVPSDSTPLELRIALTNQGPSSGAHVACSGRVVRSERRSGADEALVAVTIDQFQLRPAARSVRAQETK
jgi:hypothetical protein